MSIYLLRSKKTYKELQEDINPRSSSTRSMTTIHRNSKKRLFTTKSPGASPISKAKINFEQEPSKEINKTYTKQELIDVLIQKFSISQSKAEIYANEILKSFIFKYFIEKSEIWSLMDSYRRHNDSLNEGFLSCLYLEASGNLCKKFESSLVILITALDVIKKVNTEIKSQIDSVDLETIKQKNAISSVLNSSKNRSKSLFITSIDQLVKQVISLKLKDQKSKDAKEDYDSYMKTFSTQKKTLKFEDKPGSDLFISLRDLSNRSKDITVDEPLLSTSRSRKSSTKHAKNVNSLPILPKIDEKSEAYKNFKDIELKIKNIKKMGRSTATSETRSAYSKTPSISIEI